tara:strand:+ start:941 stop:1393 length:453 start_codon:yes stop_codon:yes gene_type:complete
MRNRRRTRYERELIKVLKEALGSEWFGHRGAHSDGVDVLMFKSLDVSPIMFCGIRFEVKSKNEPFPFYPNEREREQLQSYQDVFTDFGVETVYAFRKVGGKGEKWSFCPISCFSNSKTGNPCVRQEDAIPLHTFITTIEDICANWQDIKV